MRRTTQMLPNSKTTGLSACRWRHACNECIAVFRLLLLLPMFARCTNKDVLTGSDFHVYEAIFAHRRAETCRSQAQNKHVFLRLEGHHKSPKQLRGDLNQCELRCSPKLQRPKVLPIPHLYSCHPILLMFVCVRPGFGLGSAWVPSAQVLSFRGFLADLEF